MEKIYTAEINVNGIIGYVGGSNAEDLAEGVKACTEGIEQKIAEVIEPCDCCCCCDRMDEWDDIDTPNIANVHNFNAIGDIINQIING